MPTRPPSFIQRLNASRRAVGSGRLARAQRAQDPAQRQVDGIRGTQRWRSVSKQVLREEPVCRKCVAGGRTELAVHVDHIVSLAERPDLAFVRSNLQGLCLSCHARKGVIERGLTPRRQG